MVPYKEEKIKNAVAYFAIEHFKKARRPLYQTGLYKYLAFLDFTSLKETGRPAIELKYCAMDRGPVPIEIYSNKQKTDKYNFQKDEWGEYITVTNAPDLDYFSPYEIKLMDRLVEIFAQRWVTTSVMSDSSHEDIKAWRKAYDKKKNSIIDYSLEFDEDIFSKDEDELTYPETVYLTYKALSAS